MPPRITNSVTISTTGHSTSWENYKQAVLDLTTTKVLVLMGFINMYNRLHQFSILSKLQLRDTLCLHLNFTTEIYSVINITHKNIFKNHRQIARAQKTQLKTKKATLKNTKKPHIITARIINQIKSAFKYLTFSSFSLLIFYISIFSWRYGKLSSSSFEYLKFHLICNHMKLHRSVIGS